MREAAGLGEDVRVLVEEITERRATVALAWGRCWHGSVHDGHCPHIIAGDQLAQFRVMPGREHATLRVTGSRCRCRCGVVQEFERVDGLIGEDLAVIANVDCQELRGLRAAVLAGVVVAALEAEVVGAAVVAELALAGELVALGMRGRRRAQRDGRGGRRSTPRRRSWLRSRCAELVLLDAR